MSSRQAVAKIDWPRLASSLSLTPQTTSALNSFRKRNVDAHTKRNQLRTARTEIDFAYYRSVLKNQAVIDEIEKAAKQFKPVTYDVSTILKGIEGFEAEAVKNAEQTEKKIADQLVDLDETIKNIDQSRLPDDLSVRTHEVGLMCSLRICTRRFRICMPRLNEWSRQVFGWYINFLCD